MSELPNPLQGRENTTQQVGYLRYDYCLDNKALLVGILPRGALILDIIVKVLAPFGSDDTLNIGNDANSKYYGTASLSAVGSSSINLSPTAAAVSKTREAALLIDKATTHKTGHAIVIVTYIAR